MLCAGFGFAPLALPPLVRGRVPLRRFATAAKRPRRHPEVASHRLWLPTAGHTHALGAYLAAGAVAGDVVLLHGGLGAGKTALARGFVQAARRDPELAVTSPTYLLTNFYPPGEGEREGGCCVPSICHMDLWRVDDASARPIVDFPHVFQECVSLIEWPDRLKALTPHIRLDVFLEYPGEVQGALRVAQEDPEDPWGFGDVEPPTVGGTQNREPFATAPGTSARAGRFAVLVPRGDAWTQRVDAICVARTAKNDSGLLQLAMAG